MITREKVLEIQNYCFKNNVSIKDRIKELGITSWAYYQSKGRYTREDEESGEFVRISDGKAMSKQFTGDRPVPPPAEDVANQCYITVEMRTPSGTEVRIQGMMSPEHLREAVSAGGGHV